MKKLLKYGVVSLSLAALGVVATTTDLPVLGTTVVRAEENAQKLPLFVGYGYLTSFGRWIELDFDHIELSPGESVTIEAKDFPGYELINFNHTDIVQKSATYTYEDIEKSGSEYGLSVSFVYKLLQTPPPSDGGNDNPSTPDAPPSNPDNGDGGQGGGDTQTPPPADNDGGSNDGGSTDADKDTGTTPDTPQPPATPTPKTLGSTKVPVTVTVSGKDSSAISTIETSRVTDQSVLAKLPSHLPQADVELYDIKTVDDKGNFVQITEPATVTLSVDPSRKVGKVFYFLPETGMVEELKFTRSDDQKTVSFVVTHFSQYGVVYEPTTQTPPANNGGNTVTPPTTKTDTPTPAPKTDNTSNTTTSDKSSTQAGKTDANASTGTSKTTPVTPTASSSPAAKTENVLPKTGDAHLACPDWSRSSNDSR